MNSKYRILTALAISVCIGLIGCQRTYYAVWEKLGKEKRHLLRDQVKKATGEQEEASRQFQDTLSRIKAMYGFTGGDLEKMYAGLSDDYNRCLNREEAVRERIDNVRQIAGDLFSEWDAEIGQMNNEKLRTQSRKSLEATKERYARLHEAMKKAEASMAPVMTNLKDYVLYLKHNLNAQAVGALETEADNITIEISSLIKDMNASVREAEAFLEDFK